VAASEAHGKDGGSAWWSIGWSIVANLPQNYRSVPRKHESGIGGAWSDRQNLLEMREGVLKLGHSRYLRI
jgi:hypothetical protein